MQTLIIKTQKLAIAGPSSPGTELFKNNYIRFYTWKTPPTGPLDPLTEKYVCWSEKMNLLGSFPILPNNGQELVEFRQEYDRWYE